MNTIESLQNQVKLLNNFNIELERQMQNCRKENMGLIQQIEISYREHDKTTSELNHLKYENDRLLKEMIKKSEELKRLQKLDQAYISMNQELNRQLIQKQNYQYLNQKNQFKIKELSTKLNNIEQSYLQKISTELIKNSKLQNQIVFIKQQITTNSNKHSKLTLELQNKIKENNETCSRLNQKIKSLQTQNTNLLMKLHIQQEKITTVQNNLTGSISNNQQLHNVIKTLQINIEELNSSLKKEKSLSIQYKNLTESKLKEISSKEKTIRQLEQQIQSLKRTIEVQQQQLKQKCIEIEQLTNDLNNKNEIIKANLTIISQTQNHLKELELQLSQEKDASELNCKEIDQKKRIIFLLKQNLTQVNQDCKIKSQELESKEEMIKNIQQQLEDSIKTVSIKTIQLFQRDNNIKQLNQELKLSKKCIEQKQKQIEQKNQSFNQLNIQIVQLKEEIQKQQKLLVSREQDIIRLQSQVKQQKRKRQEQISSLMFQKQRQIDVLTYKLKSAEEKVQHKQKTLVAAFSNNQNLNNIVNIYDKKIASISNLLDQEVKQSSEYRSKLQEKQQQIKQKQVKIQQIVLQLQHIKKISKQNIRQLNLQLKQQREIKDEQIKKNQELNIKYNQLMQEKTGGQTLLTKQIQSRDQMIQQLRTKYQILQKSLENTRFQYKNQKTKLEQKFILLQQKHSNLNEGKSSLLTAIQKKENQVSLLKDELSTLKKQFQQYSQTKQKEVQELITNVNQAELSIEKKTKQIKILQKELDSSRQEFIRQKESIQILHTSFIEQLTVKAAKQFGELKAKHQGILNQKQTQISKFKEKLEIQDLEFRQKGKQQKQQSRKRQANLSQKIQLLQKEIYRLEGQIASSSISNIIEGRSKTEKQSQLATLRKVISDQQKLINDQKTSLDKLNKLFRSKEEQILTLETSNTLLRSQLINSLVNEQSSRKQNILQREKSATSLKRLSNREFRFDGKKRSTFFSQYVGVKTDRVQQIRYVSKENCASNEGSMKRSFVQEISLQKMNHTPSIQEICG